MIEKIFKLAKIEAEWLSHYGHIDSRISEDFNDIKFYDRMKPIGYSKVWTPLDKRCPMGYVDTLDINKVTDTIWGPRNHENGIYSCLEFVIYNKVDGWMELIKIIKK